MATPKEQHDARKHPINFGEAPPPEAVAEERGENPPPTSNTAPIPGSSATSTGGRGAGSERGQRRGG
jgi:hypothetical protein